MDFRHKVKELDLDGTANNAFGYPISFSLDSINCLQNDLFIIFLERFCF